MARPNQKYLDKSQYTSASLISGEDVVPVVFINPSTGDTEEGTGVIEEFTSGENIQLAVAIDPSTGMPENGWGVIEDNVDGGKIVPMIRIDSSNGEPSV